MLSGITGAARRRLRPAWPVSRLSAAFPDGILWANADQGGVLEALCRQAGLGRENETWTVRWRRWAGAPAWRVLVILDDVVDAALLAPIAGGLGQQMALVVTTQFSDAVTAEMVRWLPPAQSGAWIWRGWVEKLPGVCSSTSSGTRFRRMESGCG